MSHPRIAIVAAGAVLNALIAGFLNQAFGAYVAMLSEEKGWSKTALSGAAALQPMEAAILGPLLGWIIDRFGPQGMIRIGVIMFGIGFCLLMDCSRPQDEFRVAKSVQFACRYVRHV